MIETPRLTLRPWQDSDRDPAYAMAQDGEVMRYLPPLDRAASDAMIDRMIAMQSEHGHTFWVMEQKANAKFLATHRI